MKAARICRNTERIIDRRTWLQKSAAGFGWLALAALHAKRAGADSGGFQNPLGPREPHFPARARRVIFLFMEGGPSHLDSFDWKPELARIGGDASSRYLAPVFRFHPCGESGLMISEAYPHLREHADDLCLLNGVQTNNPGHHQAVVALHTGNENLCGRRSAPGSPTGWARRRRACRGL